MWQNLSQIFNKLSRDPEVRCVVLTASGERAFSAGLDVQVYYFVFPSRGQTDMSTLRKHQPTESCPLTKHLKIPPG